MSFKQKVQKKFPWLWGFYHYLWAWFGARLHGYPSGKIFVIGVTGTKGKTTTLEILNAILETAGKRTALLSSYREKIGEETGKNKMGNSMPGHGYIQNFLKRAVAAECGYALIEVTSQGVVAHRHRFINWNLGAITNLAPEHIESHGSFENYRDAKLAFLEYVRKKGGLIFLNRDDKYFEFFNGALEGEKTFDYSKDDAWLRENLVGASMMRSAQDTSGKKFLMSDFNKENVALAVAVARELGIPSRFVKDAIENFAGVPGRMEFVRVGPYTAIVDYAHTPDSLEAAYRAARPEPSPNYSHPRLICILGGAGGGRDIWKRPEMGKIAAHYCDEIILSNEDPYDEDPVAILGQIEKGIVEVPYPRPEVFKILDRREAIQKAVSDMQEGDVVIGTGKGSEDWIHVAHGKKISWNERGEFEKALLDKKNAPTP
jgi:UDP-N-acetylmuramoyl-L-alanyl-D-glutamate--2,6-diaminopimelate ligase